MGILDETRFVERLQFFNGQRLFASDLQGIEAFNREMRWLHNQSLHQPGVGNGFAVSGETGAREVKIRPGYTIDSLGREIVLTETLVEPIPPVSAEDDGKSVFFDLTVSYPVDSELEEAETREGICLPRGVVRLREASVFCWIRLERDGQGNLRQKSPNPQLQKDIKDGLKIVLARAEVLNCQLNQPISIAQRRNARPAKQPYINCATIKPKWNLWDPITSELLSSNSPIPVSVPSENPIILPFGLTTEISTKVAGFVTTPCYSAHIVGSRTYSKPDSTSASIFLIDPLLDIVYPGRDKFTGEVLLMAQLLGQGDNLNTSDIIDKANKDWGLVWMGVEG